LAYRLAVADGDAARLEALRDIAHEVDVEQAVLEAGALDLDVVGELEAALERAGGDAAVQELRVLVLGLLLAANVEVCSLTSIFSSSWLKPATAMVMR
jgi:hypothetical protein